MFKKYQRRSICTDRKKQIYYQEQWWILRLSETSYAPCPRATLLGPVDTLKYATLVLLMHASFLKQAEFDLRPVPCAIHERFDSTSTAEHGTGLLFCKIYAENCKIRFYFSHRLWRREVPCSIFRFSTCSAPLSNLHASQLGCFGKEVCTSSTIVTYSRVFIGERRVALGRVAYDNPFSRHHK